MSPDRIHLYKLSASMSYVLVSSKFKAMAFWYVFTAKAATELSIARKCSPELLCLGSHRTYPMP